MSSQTRRSAGLIPLNDAWSTANGATFTIPDVLRGLEAVAVAVIGEDGELRDANRGFLLLMTRSLAAPRPADVRGLFVSPPFSELVARRTDPFEATLYRGLLSLGKPGGKITSLRGTVYESEEEYVLVAEHDIVGTEVLRSTLLELQDELDKKQREIVHLEHRIIRLQELADAAMRDRDTLLAALANPGV